LYAREAEGIVETMKEITFTVEAMLGGGWVCRRWDDAPGKGGITTQGESLAELHAMVADAVNGYFEPAGGLDGYGCISRKTLLVSLA